MRFLDLPGVGRALLLDDPPDWSAGMATSHEATSEVETGLTGRERRVERSPERLRTAQAWTCTLDEDRWAAAQLVLASWQNEPVAFPFWPAIQAAGAPLYGAALWIAGYADGTVAVTPQPPALQPQWFAPLLVGRLRETPRSTLIHGAATELTLDAEDNDPARALVVPDAVLVPGPPDGRGNPRPILPAWPNMAESQQSGSAELRVEWADHPPSLTRQSAFWPQPPARPLDLAFTFATAPEAAAWLGFFAALGGQAGTLWAPAWTRRTSLAASASAGSTALVVTDAAALGAAGLAGQTLALFAAPVAEVVRIASVTGNTLTLTTPLAHSWGVQDALVCPAVLVRFASSRLDLRWNTPALAGCSAGFIEVPAELGNTPEETPATAGRIPQLANLYQFELHGAQGILETRRFTDAAETISVAGQSFEPRPFTRDTLRASLDLEDDGLTLRVRDFSGNPLQPSKLASTPGVWRIEVLEYDGTSARSLWYGDVASVEADGPFLTARAVRLGGLAERKFPSALVQTTCNYALGSRACGVNLAAFTMDGVGISIGANTVLVDPVPVTGSDIFTGWFAGGYLTVTATGLRYRIRTDALQPTWNRLLQVDGEPGLAVGTAVTITAGCDGRAVTCRAWANPGNTAGKFNNYARFGGFPFLPVGNPSATKITQTAPATGKK